MSRVTEIRYVGYGVPDLAAERAFYNDQWKLVEVGEQDGMVHFAAEGGTEHHVVRLRQNDDTRIDVIALAADTAPMSMRCMRRSPPPVRASSSRRAI
jgi:catechol 2,3-dioxygenase-like lactoylglutathione lyase family enzyme